MRVKETEILHDNIEKTIDGCDLRGPLRKVTGKTDQGSDEDDISNHWFDIQVKRKRENIKKVSLSRI